MTQRHALHVTVPIPAAYADEVGDTEAYTIALARADHVATREATDPELQSYEVLPQEAPATNPDTGEPLPPMRAYRFTYLGTPIPA